MARTDSPDNSNEVMMSMDARDIGDMSEAVQEQQEVLVDQVEVPLGDEGGVASRLSHSSHDPWPYLHHNFLFMSAGKGTNSKDAGYLKLVYERQLCKPKKAILHCNSSSRGSLARHIQSHHKDQAADFAKLLQCNIRKGGRPSKKMAADLARKDTQPSVTTLFQGGRSSSRSADLVSQSKLDEAVVRFVVQSGQPFQIIEDASFINLVSGCLCIKFSLAG